jgi:restriction endonuclease S subunit
MQNKSGKTSLINESCLKRDFPLAYDYLKRNKTILQSRDNGKISVGSWYGFSRNQALDVISTPKIFTPDISPSASFAIDKKGDTFFTGGVSGGYGIKVKTGINELYILGLLNSKLLDWYVKQVSTQMRGGWFSYEAKFIKNIPIILPTKENQSIHDEIVKLVDSLLKFQKQKQSATLPAQVEQIEQRIKYIDLQINQKVYELYGMTDKINFIENAI